MTTTLPTVEYEPAADEDLSTAIVNALSEAKGRDITEDKCLLYNNIDPDALDGMFRQQGDDATIKVEFTTHDAIVILWGNGRINIEVQDLENEPSPA